MSGIKNDKKDVDKETPTLKKEPMLSSSLTVLNKSSDIDPIPSLNDQGSIALNIISKKSEVRRFAETTQPNINPGNGLGSPEGNQIEKIAMIPSSHPTDEIPIDSISFEGKLNFRYAVA